MPFSRKEDNRKSFDSVRLRRSSPQDDKLTLFMQQSIKPRSNDVQQTYGLKPVPFTSIHAFRYATVACSPRLSTEAIMLLIMVKTCEAA